MTYYAVTNDPNELAHFGIKGMKWGVRRTDAQLGHPRHTGSKRPRSAAYKKAQSKLGKMMKSGIKKAEANWRAYNSPEAKYERQTNKAIQLARKGKLKYGKLTDDQVRRVTQRLDLERQARQLGNTEQGYIHRLRKSIGEGVIQGVGQGFGRVVSEKISRGSTLKTDRLRAEQQAEFDKAREKRQLRNDKIRSKMQIESEIRKDNEKAENAAKMARKQAKRDLESEYIKMRIEEGDSVGFRNRVANRLPGATQRRIDYLHNTKERRETANDLKERKREQRQAEISTARELAKAKIDRAWKDYENRMNTYATEVKEWRKSGSLGPAPVAPKKPKITSKAFYDEYDKLRDRRGVRN